MSILFKHAILYGIAALLISSCGSTAYVEKAPGVDLSKYKTYSWAPEDEKKDSNRRNQILDQRIHYAVDKQLQQNGLTKVERDPDVFVCADLMVEKTEQQRNDPVYTRPYSRTFYNRFTGRFYTYYFPSQFLGYDSYSTTIKEGKVIVTLIDPESDKAVWQGWASRELTSRKISDSDIDKNIESIFRKFE